MQPRRTKTLLLTALLGLGWAAGIAFGFRSLLQYERAPGRIGAVPNTWPSDSRIERATDQATLVMLAHPRCPCTAASIADLEQMMAHIQGKISAYVLFLKPDGSSGEWDNTNLRRNAAAIPGVKVLSDIDGIEARRFGVETSGHTLLYARDGRLLFSGGITESRGHAGDNTGQRAIESLFNDVNPVRASTFVFGCALADRSQERDKKRCLK